jgi:hypothetical protein
MAGDDNRDGVAIVRHADGAKRVWLADGASNVRVGARLAVRELPAVRASRLAGNPCREDRVGKVNWRRLPAKYSSSSLR